MAFEAIIGLEIHIELKTKTKMFSSAPVRYGDEPNTDVVAYDFAFPGVMPTVNEGAVICALRLCNALHMDIDRELHFDRKNYFYSDLPKGYQITQRFRPIGRNGYLTITLDDGTEKKIELEELHLEEDTCKQLHSYDCTLIDYNRAGTPLIEIVSKPDLRSANEAMKYIEEIRSIVSYLDVSDGRMEEGSLRCDVDISIREVGSSEYGTKVEIKNLNSIANVEKVLNYEFARQVQCLETGEAILQETRRFDESLKQTVGMRSKEDSVDYKYYPEPNIIPIRLSDTFVDRAIASSNELASSKLKRYTEQGLNHYDASILIADKDTSIYFDQIVENGVSYKLAANWVIGDIQSVLNRDNISILEFPVSPKQIAEIIARIEKNEINNKQAREIFAKLYEDRSLSIEDLSKAFNQGMINDVSDLRGLVNEVLDENPQSVTDYLAGRDKALGYLMGQLMKKTQGKINPKDANEILLEELLRR
ncbi:MAG: Asp-tRNA(Asn)/Glu-tRNA(Gln) amidotransferase subunit GatB [Coprobacillus sp.]|nr:Asp-tRNA(Asn)/Glu-tRNA(Gln) amidotransferase subunit GatB [Coprobacillus sp.]